MGRMQLAYEDFLREYRKLKRESEGSMAGTGTSLMKTTSDMPSVIHHEMAKSVREPRNDRLKKIDDVLKLTKQLTDTLEGQLKALDEKKVFGERHAKK